MQNFDAHSFPFPSRRRVVYAKRGMVSSTHPLASEAGLRMLSKGGNAVDAAVAMAAALTVLEPNSNGIGSDNFALVWRDGKLHGLNSSGRSPAALTYERLEKAGHKKMPELGWEAVTVPGAPAGWAALSERFGKLPFDELFEPAIEYASEGFPASAFLVKEQQAVINRYTRDLGNLAQGFLDTFTNDGKPLMPGEIRTYPGHARALEHIAKSKARDFYEGEIAEAITAFSKATGGLIDKDDLAGHRADWVEPIGTNYRGYDIWEIPPNGQGIVALMALKMLSGFDFSREAFGTERTLHLQIEALKLAFADAFAQVGDPKDMPVSVKQMLDGDYLHRRVSLIGERAQLFSAGELPRGGTVYFCAADDSGTMISMIQSNYMGYGSGIVVPNWGISLQNRGACFTMEQGHPNAPAPRKRPYHTIIPSFITRNGEPVGPMGIMGGFMQPQAHVQVAMNLIDFNMNPQAALDAPRFCFTQGMDVSIESGFNTASLDGLYRKGHKLCILNPDSSLLFGRGQLILKTPGGALAGGTEPRGDGSIYVR